MALSLSEVQKKQVRRAKTRSSATKPVGEKPQTQTKAQRPWQPAQISLNSGHSTAAKSSRPTSRIPLNQSAPSQIEDSAESQDGISQWLEKIQKTVEAFAQQKWLKAQRHSYFLSKLTYARSPLRDFFREIKKTIQKHH